MSIPLEERSRLGNEFMKKWQELCKRARHLRGFDGGKSKVASQVFTDAYDLTGKHFLNLDHLIGFGGTIGWSESREKYFIAHGTSNILKEPVSWAETYSAQFEAEYPRFICHTSIDTPIKDVIAMQRLGSEWVPVKDATEPQTIKGTKMNHTKAIVVTIGNSLEGIVLPFSEELLNALMASRVVNTKRGINAQSSDTIHYTPDHASPRVVVVKSSDVTSAPVPKAEKLVIAEKEIAELEEKLENMKRSKQEIAATY